MALPGNKLNQALTAYAEGNTVKYLAVFKNFPFGFTKDESRAIQISHEILTDPELATGYKSLGIVAADIHAEAESAVQRYIKHRADNEK